MEDSNAALALDFELPFEKLGLKTGAPLNLEAADLSARYRVKLIGYLAGNSVIVSSPVVEGKQIVLTRDRPFTVRSLAKNNAFAFQSSVKAVALQPYPYVHLEYPREMVTIKIRNADRQEVDIPARVASDFDIGNGEWPKQGTIYDLSKTGAGLRSGENLGDNGDEIVLHFPVRVAGVTKNFKLAAIIRNKLILEAEYLPLKFGYGLQFKELSDAAKIVLCGYIYELQASD